MRKYKSMDKDFQEFLLSGNLKTNLAKAAKKYERIDFPEEPQEITIYNQTVRIEKYSSEEKHA